MKPSTIFDELKAKLAKYPSVRYEFSESTFHIFKSNEEGFTIGIHLDHEEFTVTFDDWHGHFDSEEETLNFVGFGLSDSCRLQVVSRGGVPCKWNIQSKQDSGWHTEYTTGLLLHKFWGRKIESIFQNKLIQGG